MLKREHWKFSETLSRAHPNLKLLIWLTQIAICGIVLLAAPRARSQTEPAFSLASRSSIVVLGTVAKINASEESLLKPSRSTVVITLKRMFAGSQFAGDQTGRTATVILSKPGAAKAGSDIFFFGNPQFIGKTLTIADEGEIPAPAARTATTSLPGLERGLEAHRDAPIRDRLAIAQLVFLGTVQSVRAPEAEQKKRQPGDEHNPEWQLALVHVDLVFRGTKKQGEVVPLIFPASRDVAWVDSPKFHAGDQVLVLAHQPEPNEMPLLREILTVVREQHAFIVSAPHDVLPISEEERLMELLQTRGMQ